MKKTLLTFIIALLAATGAWAQTTFTVDNLKYTVTKHGIQRDQHRQLCVLRLRFPYGSDHTRQRD